MLIRFLKQIIRPSEFGNHLGKALGGAPVFQNADKFFLPGLRILRQPTKLKQDTTQGKGHRT